MLVLPGDGDLLFRLGLDEVDMHALGDDVVDHYLHFYEVEVAAHRVAVSDWERARYFERI